MSENMHYYMCDKCGSISDISSTPHLETDTWACADCGSEALWHFTDQAKAMQYGNDVRDRKYNEDMRRLNDAIARAEEHSA